MQMNMKCKEADLFFHKPTEFYKVTEVWKQLILANAIHLALNNSFIYHYYFINLILI